MTKPIAVLDTNVVLDIFYWDGKSCPALARQIDHLHLVTEPRCLHELQRILARLCAEPQRTEAVLAQYGARTETLPAVPPLPQLPRCKDVQDQKFLELAVHAGARWLVTRDKALLALKRRKTLPPHLAILTPEHAARAIAGEFGHA
ncbi:MAG: putative toxin-antitoxin system toxin component, PIN family [Rhodocyclaceae bacterium]|nr:putative toxin-antitoxin system toxin component, PIN family [Rhodocyclaceae bacterium]